MSIDYETTIIKYLDDLTTQFEGSMRAVRILVHDMQERLTSTKKMGGEE